MAFFCPIFPKHSAAKAKEYEDSNYFSFDGGGQSLYSSRSMTALNFTQPSKDDDDDDANDQKDPSSTRRLIVTCDFEPTVDDELRVRRGDVVNGLYRDREWMYVVREGQSDDQSETREGFIPSIYCEEIDPNKTRRPSEKSPTFAFFKAAFTRRQGKGKCEAEEIDLNTSKTSSGSVVVDDNKIGDSSVASSPARPKGLINVDRFLKSLDARNSDCDFPVDQRIHEKLSTFGCITDFLKAPQGRLIADFDFAARCEDDVNVKKGDVVLLLNKDDPDWFWIRRENGDEGFVPSNYVRTYTGDKPVSPLINNERCSSEDRTVQFNELTIVADFEPEAADDLRVIRGDWIYSYQTSALSEKGWLWAYCPRTKRYGFVPHSIVRAPVSTIL